MSELLVRHEGTARFRFRGNEELCRKYIPLARLFQGQVRSNLSLAGVDSDIRHRRLPDGTLIKNLYDGVLDIIEIDTTETTPSEGSQFCRYYMESGLVSYNWPGLENISATQEGILYRAPEDKIPYFKEENKPSAITVNPPVNGIGKLIFQPMPEMTGNEAEIDSDGDGEMDGTILGGTSKAFGISVADDATEAEIEAARTKLFLKMLCANFVPPSLYTGKMKEFVQALYGDHINDWRANLKIGVFEYPRIELDGIDLHWNHSDTVGIFHDYDKFEYWLIEIVGQNGRTVRARKLNPNTCGSMLKSYILHEKSLVTWSDFEKNTLPLIEPILLSTLSISDISYELGTFELAWEPFDQHGWKFNRRGTQADLITHEIVYATPGVSSSYTNRVARHGRLQFEINEDFDSSDGSLPINMTYTLVEETDYHFRPNGDLIHYRDYILGITLTVVTPLTAVTPYGDAPIYCIWKDDENGDEYLDVRRYYYHSETVAAPPVGYNSSPTLWSCCGCLEDGGCHDDYYGPWPGTFDQTGIDVVDYIWGTVVTSGFYSDAHDGRLTHGTNEYHRYRILEIEAEAEPTPDPYVPGENYQHNTIDGLGGLGCAYWGGFDPLPYRAGLLKAQTFKYVETKFIDDRSSAATTFDTLLIIPAYDAGSYYDGHAETIGARSVVDNQPYNETLGKTWFWYGYPGMPVGGVGILQGGECWPQTATLASSGYLYDNSASYGTVYTAHLELIAKNTITEVADVETEDFYGGFGSWDAVFNPPMNVDPQIYFPFYVMQSLHGDWRAFVTDVNSPDARIRGRYPYFSQSSYVGQA